MVRFRSQLFVAERHDEFGFRGAHGVFNRDVADRARKARDHGDLHESARSALRNQWELVHFAAGGRRARHHAAAPGGKAAPSGTNYFFLGGGWRAFPGE